MFGPLSKATKIHIKYNDQNILCLEKLQVESLDKSLQFNLIQVTNTTSKHCDRLFAKKEFVFDLYSLTPNFFLAFINHTVELLTFFV